MDVPASRNAQSTHLDFVVSNRLRVPWRIARDILDGHMARHAGTVRATHWITFAAFVALLVSGVEILISHPRFYWGETGNVLMQPLFTLPIPASRGSVPTGYGYVLKDQNSWSRSLHFQTGWALAFTGLAYTIWGFATRHFRGNLLPPEGREPGSYNTPQRLTYLAVIFGLFPLMFWTGLAMSPGFVAGFPLTASLLGGQQSARTIHFFATVLLVLFLFVHVAKVWQAGFWTRTRAMITGHAD